MRYRYVCSDNVFFQTKCRKKRTYRRNLQLCQGGLWRLCRLQLSLGILDERNTGSNLFHNSTVPNLGKLLRFVRKRRKPVFLRCRLCNNVAVCFIDFERRKSSGNSERHSSFGKSCTYFGSCCSYPAWRSF